MGATNGPGTRYQRQLRLPGWGEAGQRRLAAAHVVVVGAGGLGGPVAIYLAAAGVGRLTIIDGDRIEWSNLNRQILHPEARVGEVKAVSAGQTLRGLNSAVSVIVTRERLADDNCGRLLGVPDLIVDGVDNYATRYLLNRYCLDKGVPWVHAAIHGWSGQLSLIHAPLTPCLRCIVPVEPPVEEQGPVVGATPGVIGAMAAMEALKHLTGIGTTLAGRLLVFDGETMNTLITSTRRCANCPDCGDTDVGN